MLSIRQPWAWLIVNGHKDIENRTWKTKFRGRFLVHASKTIDKEAFKKFAHYGHRLSEATECGGIVGEVELVDCVQHSDSQWFDGPNGFVLRAAKTLPFHPCRGQLNFFEYNYSNVGSDSKADK